MNLNFMCCVKKSKKVDKIAKKVAKKANNFAKKGNKDNK